MWGGGGGGAGTIRVGLKMAAKRGRRFHVAPEALNVQTILIVDGPTAVRHCNDLSSMQMEESCCPAAHVAKTLYRTDDLRSDSALSAAFCCPLMENRGWSTDGKQPTSPRRTSRQVPKPFYASSQRSRQANRSIADVHS